MTVTSEQRLVVSRAANSLDRNAAKPPPKVFSVAESPFKGYQPPQPDGYQQSKASPSSSAIVIDNGRRTFRGLMGLGSSY
jgi:actin-related protein 5